MQSLEVILSLMVNLDWDSVLDVGQLLRGTDEVILFACNILLRLPLVVGGPV